MDETLNREDLLQERWNNYVRNFSKDPKHLKEIEAYRFGGLVEPGFQNIIEHQLKARLIVETLCDEFGIQENDRENAVTAITIHDFNVMPEKIGKRSGTIKNYIDLEALKKNNSNTLMQLGFVDDVVNLTDKNITDDNGGPYDLPGMFIFVADSCLSGKEIVNIPERFELTRNGWRSDQGKFDEITAKENQYYFDEFWKGAPGFGDEPHDIVQMRTAKRICKALMDKLKDLNHEDVSNPKYADIFAEGADPFKFTDYLKAKVEEKLLSANY